MCSKGKQEYVQLLWHMLDPLCQLFPKTGGWVGLGNCAVRAEWAG